MYKISVITVNYNDLNGLKSTVDSVINQTYKCIEYIVIDGGSNDGSKEFIDSHKNYFFYSVSEKDKGIYNAMNKGLAISTGEYVIFMNSGDVFFDNNVVEAVFSNPKLNADIIYGSTVCKIDNLGYVQPPFPLDYLEKMKTSPICHQSTFIKGSLMRSRGYNENYKILSDYDFFHSCYREGRSFERVEKIISIYDKTGFSASPKNYKQKYIERCLINNDKPSKVKGVLKLIQCYLYQLFPALMSKSNTRLNFQSVKSIRQL